VPTYTPHEGDVTCSRCGAPRTGKIVKNSVFLKEEKICYKMIYYTLYTLYLDSVNRQKSRCTVRT